MAVSPHSIHQHACIGWMGIMLYSEGDRLLLDTSDRIHLLRKDPTCLFISIVADVSGNLGSWQFFGGYIQCYASQNLTVVYDIPTNRYYEAVGTSCATIWYFHTAPRSNVSRGEYLSSTIYYSMNSLKKKRRSKWNQPWGYCIGV